MGPCAVCGGGTIDAAGNCTQCGNYRGTNDVVSGPPAGYTPTSGAGYNPYPASGGATGYPTSGGAAYPSSPPPPPAYQPPPTPPQAYAPPPPQAYPPVYTPPPPQNKGRRGLNILIGTLVAVVAVLLCCIGGGVWFSNLPDAEPSGTPTPSVLANPNVDACTVGTWNVASHAEDLEVNGVGTIKLSGGRGVKLTLSDNGTAVVDYGTGAEYTGSVSGQNVRLRIKGPVTYDFTARDGRLKLTGVDTDATFVIYINGEETASEQEFLAADDSSSYTCADDRLTQTGAAYTIEYTRG